MYMNTDYNPSITINLDNGIYIFNNESATGKTRLCKRLKDLKAYGEPVDSFTYNDLLRGIRLDSVLTPVNKVILLDRYDLYKTEGYDLINKCADNSIILIDCKTPFMGSLDIEDCFIEMGEDSIVVTI